MRTSVKTTVVKRRKKKFEWYMIPAIIIFPFYKLYQGLVWLYNNIFFEDIRTGDNGIIGPGYHVWYTTKFSWGKVSFFLLLIVVILIGVLYFRY